MRRASLMIGVGLSVLALFWLAIPRGHQPAFICDPLWPERVTPLELNPGQFRLYVKRSPWMSDNSTVGVFKVDPAGKTATRVPVQFGATIRDYIEVKVGLKAGDQIIASDMSRLDSYDRVKLDEWCSATMEYRMP